MGCDSHHHQKLGGVIGVRCRKLKWLCEIYISIFCAMQYNLLSKPGYCEHKVTVNILWTRTSNKASI